MRYAKSTDCQEKRFDPRPLLLFQELTIPRADPINSFTMGGIIRDAGFTIEEFKKLL